MGEGKSIAKNFIVAKMVVGERKSRFGKVKRFMPRFFTECFARYSQFKRMRKAFGHIVDFGRMLDK